MAQVDAQKIIETLSQKLAQKELDLTILEIALRDAEEKLAAYEEPNDPERDDEG